MTKFKHFASWFDSNLTWTDFASGLLSRQKTIASCPKPFVSGLVSALLVAHNHYLRSLKADQTCKKTIFTKPRNVPKNSLIAQLFGKFTKKSHTNGQKKNGLPKF